MKNLLAMLIGAFLISGCATIADLSKGSKQKIYFTTPSGKSVIAVIDGQRVTLPAVVGVKKSGDVILSIFAADNPGYQNYTGNLSSLNVEPNFMLSGFSPFIIISALQSA